MILAANPASTGLSWWHIIRLGLIQTALGGIVVLTTSTLNRIMVVELALAARMVPSPGVLLAASHASEAEAGLICPAAQGSEARWASAVSEKQETSMVWVKFASLVST